MENENCVFMVILLVSGNLSKFSVTRLTLSFSTLEKLSAGIVALLEFAF